MKINRKQLLNNLQNFALRGNGVIIGSPGVGKTYLLKELRRSLKSTAHRICSYPLTNSGRALTQIYSVNYHTKAI